MITLMIFSYTTIVLLEWYITPVLNGMNTTIDYLQSNNKNYFLAIQDYDEDDLIKQFKNDFDNNMENGMSIEENLEITFTKISDFQEEKLKELYSLIIYLFSPLVTLYAVLFFHVWFWSKISMKVSNFIINRFIDRQAKETITE